ncbi:MAG: hypothetical protein FVQ77_05385 [Cytophagales bacterium]|nr:hypothetical protein [Cytophagales bacterium]
MKHFIIDTEKNRVKDLAELDEDTITIRRIEAANMDEVMDSSLFINTKYDMRSSGNALTPGAFDVRTDKQTGKVAVLLSHRIEECRRTTIEQHGKGKLTVFYETLDDILNGIKKKEEESRVNIKEEIKNWQNAVNDLFDTISTDWLKKYAPNITTKMTGIKITEELTGQYGINQLHISLIKNKEIVLIPRATFVIGSHGRIDMMIKGIRHDPIMIIRFRGNGKDRWEIIFDRNIRDRIEFNKAQLENIITDVIYG